jgi:hypothetical protein
VAAFDCFAEARAAGEDAKVDFLLLGTEGETDRAALQTRDAAVDYIRRTGVIDWEVSTGCLECEVQPPGFPEVARCEEER